jgi:DNA polymerase I-like protein with 3'-5' exonuclease and polymerase domains/uracil-DNA glycosylase
MPPYSQTFPPPGATSSFQNPSGVAPPQISPRRAPTVQSRGPSKARLMVISDIPDKQSAALRLAFSSPMEQKVEDYLRSAGMNMREVYFTYMHKHPEPRGIHSLFDQATGIPSLEMMRSIMELHEEIESVNPSCILVCGAATLKQLTFANECIRWDKGKKGDTIKGFVGIGDWRGSIIAASDAFGGRKLVACDHPRTLAYEWERRIFLQLDCKRAVEQSAYPDIRRPQREIIIAPAGSDRVYWRDKLLDGSLLSSDIEWINGRLLCTSFCNSSTATVVIPAETSEDIRFTRELLESGVPLCFQNGMFDASVLEWHHKWEIFKHVQHDTMLAAHSRYVELPKDLGTLCSIYTEQPCYWNKIKWRDIASGKQPISDVYEYNGIDSWVTHEVARQQIADDLTGEDSWARKILDFELGLLQPLWSMSRAGVRYGKHNEAALRDAVREMGAYHQEQLASLNYGNPLNVGSPKQVIEFLYNLHGFKKPKEKNAKLTDDKTLADLGLQASTEIQRKAIVCLRAARKARSLESKFFKIQMGPDGRFRSHYAISGTDTWRLASKKFYPTGEGSNGQNIPTPQTIIQWEREPLKFDVRTLFVPDPGHVFFYNDLERAESYVVAHYTGDPLMLEHHKPGADAHTLLAMELFNKSFDAITKDERYMGKRTRHAGNYMQAWKTFMLNVNKMADITGVWISAAQAKTYIARYRDLHICLESWWSSVREQLISKGYIENLFGFRRHFYSRIGDALPSAVAFMPQSTVGVAVNMALSNIFASEEARDLGIQPLLQVHDAIGGQIPEANVEAAQTLLGRLMSIPIPNPRTGENILIPVELAVGDSWGGVRKQRTVHHTELLAA